VLVAIIWLRPCVIKVFASSIRLWVNIFIAQDRSHITADCLIWLVGMVSRANRISSLAGRTMREDLADL
jgi:hypothetical protein